GPMSSPKFPTHPILELTPAYPEVLAMLANYHRHICNAVPWISPQLDLTVQRERHHLLTLGQLSLFFLLSTNKLHYRPMDIHRLNTLVFNLSLQLLRNRGFSSVIPQPLLRYITAKYLGKFHYPTFHLFVAQQPNLKVGSLLERAIRNSTINYLR